MNRIDKPLTSAMDNVLAWRIGKALTKVRRHSDGDYIDVGLALLAELNAAGFDVVRRLSTEEEWMMTNQTESGEAEALLPCPFCGDMQDSFAGMHKDAFAKCSDGALSINCACGALGPSGKTMQEAIAAWNRRTASTEELERRVKRLEEALDRIATAKVAFNAHPVGVIATMQEWALAALREE